ncbi:hypothetical protein JCM10207_001588 [Rhodosporidiobolus poonsookiae]
MTSWELSPLYRHHQSLVLPDSTRIASFHNGRVVLRALDSLHIFRTWSLFAPTPAPASSTRPSASAAAPAQPLTELTSFVVSPAAPHYILCFAAKLRTAWMLDPNSDEVAAKLEVGNEGAVRMEWAQVGREDGEGDAVAMAWSAHHLRLSLYYLSSPTSPALHIQNPKHSHASGHAFHPQRKFLAILERHNSRDVIGIYSTKGEWALVRSITLPDPSSDLAGLNWSPCGKYIATWSHITEYTVHFYLPAGQLVSTFSPYSSLSPPSAAPSSGTARRRPAPAEPKETETGKELSAENRKREERSTASYVGLGVRTVEWHPSGGWVAVGGFDGKIRILTHHGFVPVAELALPLRLVQPVRLWKEPQGWIEKTRGKGIVSFDRILTFPYSLTPVIANPAVPSPKMGFSRLSWSPSGNWLVALNQSFPAALAIFSFPPSLSSASSPTPDSPSSPSFARPALHTVLFLAQPVRDFAFQPAPDAEEESEMLVVASGESAFTVWRAPANQGGAGEAEGVGVPAGQTPFPLSTLSFAPSGTALVLSAPPTSATGASVPTASAKEAGGVFCVAYPVAAEGESVLLGVGEGEGRTWMEEGSEEE